MYSIRLNVIYHLSDALESNFKVILSFYRRKLWGSNERKTVTTLVVAIAVIECDLLFSRRTDRLHRRL